MLARVRRFLAPRPPGPVAGGLAWNDLYPARPPAGVLQRAYPAPRAVPASTASVILAAANPARRTLSVYNASTATLYLATGSFASPASYAVAIAPGGLWTTTEPGQWIGDVAGVWSAVDGSAQVTETT
jgi:hypothetical protein